MPLANMRDLLHLAKIGGYAVGSFSVANMECIEGVMAAAEATRSPLILQIAEARLDYSPLYLIGPMMMAAAQKATVPVAVHLDHGRTAECVKQALELGFTSVMFDGSALDIKDNLAKTREIIEMAKPYGASVESEVGSVGKTEDAKDCPMKIATFDDCLAMDALGVDALAIGIGNAHGLYAAVPHLHYEVVEQVSAKIKAPLVLHGGTGLTDEQFRKVITLGMRKINIATDIFIACCSAHTKKDLFTDIASAREQVKATVQRYITLFGSAGKAE